MFDTILLLAEPPEQAALASMLQQRNPRLNIRAVTTRQDMHTIDKDVLGHCRLLAFVTPVIVPADILRLVGHGAYNFHPGPPDYPGWAPAHFALHEQARTFGVTFHVMAARVDSGPILDVDRFAIPSGATVLSLEEAAYRHLLQMFVRWAARLARDPGPLVARRRARWSGRRNSRESYRALCELPLDISGEDFSRRMRIFGEGHFGVRPSVRLHGIEFRMVTQDPDGIMPADHTLQREV